MAVTIPQAAQIVCSGRMFAEETWANVFHVNIGTGGFGSTEADEIQEAFRDYYEKLPSRRTNQWSCDTITVRDIREEGRETFQYVGLDIDGTSGVAPVPPQCAMVVTLRSATNSRRGRGRTYLNGFLYTAVNAGTGQWVNARCDDEGADYATLGQDLLAAGYNLAVASRVANQLFGVETVTIDSVIDTQRRRVKDMTANYKGNYGVTAPPP